MMTINNQLWFYTDKWDPVVVKDKIMLIRIHHSSEQKRIRLWSINRGPINTAGINCNRHFAAKSSQRCQIIRLPVGWPATTDCFTGSPISLTLLPSMYVTSTYYRTSSNSWWPTPISGQHPMCKPCAQCGTPLWHYMTDPWTWWIWLLMSLVMGLEPLVTRMYQSMLETTPDLQNSYLPTEPANNYDIILLLTFLPLLYCSKL